MGISLQRDVSEFLSCQPWTHWATLTYRLQPSVRTAGTHARRWLEKFGVDAAYYCTERGTIGGRPHNHALILLDGGADLFGVDAMWEDWNRRYGRVHVEAYDPKLGAAGYVSKYVVKAPDFWDIHFKRGHEWMKPQSRQSKR